ncbi:phospholipase D/transphosphatidylase [Gallaecimonas xiamenensis 3-C-1]|uniref:Phospholipase D/transphosphatidylase n=2 Tax=Gallaecimonas TaxID=745410 RepID=K2J0Z9_9GAMM|nr:phospholipase D/transphosphatidylase [Gallaecimonas xiamenensis 3-C-1]
MLLPLLWGCTTLALQPNKPAQVALPPAANPALTLPQTAFALLPDGANAFLARAALASLATQSLDLQYYLYQNDHSGQLLLERLLAAADRGVRVRLLVDDLYSDQLPAALALHPNIQVRLFNPWVLRNRPILKGLEFVGKGRLNHRMHNKAWIADNRVAIVGGRNIGDQYFDQAKDSNFRDLDLLAASPVVKELSASFDAFWNSPWTVTLPVPQSANLDDLRASLAAATKTPSPFQPFWQQARQIPALKDWPGPWYQGQARLVADSPDKVEGSAATSLLAQLGHSLPQAQSRLWISSPYFIPGDQGVALLANLVQQGVEVRVLTNSLAANDVPAVHSHYQRYRQPLLAAGVHLYEQKSALTSPQGLSLGSAKASLHAKAFVVDSRYSFIGSMNLDPRSLHRNTELGLVVDSPALAQRLEALMTEDLATSAFALSLDNDRLNWCSQGQCQDSEPEISLWQHIKNGFFWLLPIESQL